MSTTQVTEYVDKLISKGGGQVVWLDIDEVKEDPKNPRHISKKKLEELKKSISEFPEMMVLRPGVVDENNVLQGANQRHKACKALGWHKFPVIYAKDLTPEQLKEFTIKDNVSFGEWDIQALKEWDPTQLAAWSINAPGLFGAEKIPGEIVFSPELDQESNYVVLKFNKDIDFLQVQTMLGLQSVYSYRQNGKPWAKGVGRVVDGVTAIKNIQKAGNEL